MQTLNLSVLFAGLCFFSGLLSLLVIMRVSSHWEKKSVITLIFLMISVFAWSVVDGLGFIYPEAASKMWWYRINYICVQWVALFLFYFVSLMVSSKLELNKRYYLLAIFPLTMSLLVCTNEFHHLVWQDMSVYDNGRFSVPVYSHGPGYWLTTIFSYCLTLWACLILIRALIKAKGMIRHQQMLVLAGILFPWFFNIIYAFGPEALKQINFTPLAFSFSGIFFLLALQRYQMLNLIPFSHKIIIENMVDPVIILNKKFQIIDVNPAVKKFFEIKDAFLSGMSFKDVLPQLYDQIISFMQKKTPVETQISFKIGYTLKHWNLSFSPLEKKKNHQIGWLIILRDITAWKNAQNALLESGRLHKLVLETSPNPIAFYNEKAETTYVNRAFSRVFGWQQHEVLGRAINFVPEDILESTQLNVQKIFERPGEDHNFVSRRYTKSREVVDVNINAISFSSKGGPPDSMVVNYTDISHIKKTERELIRTQEFTRKIINSMPSALIGLDVNAIVSHWNTEAHRFTRISPEQAMGRSLEDVCPPFSRHISMVKKAIDGQEVQKEEKIKLTFPNGSILTDITVYPILFNNNHGAVIRVDDVSEKVRMEEVMVQSEKMLSVGGLAAGMAHEINNPLAGILQNNQVIMDRLTKDFPANIRAAQDCGVDLEKMRAYLDQREIFSMMDLVKSSGIQAAKIVSNMLSFSRKSENKKSTHYLHDILDATVEMVSHDYNMKKKYDFQAIEIIREYQEGVPSVICEKNEIQQVFLNILKNGAEAMADAGVESPQYILRSSNIQSEVVIEIENNGPGIAEETKNRIFEPFFTTKEVGNGTGLGLSVSYFIINKNHGGSLSVESSPGKGTTFFIKIPAEIN